MHYIVIDLEFNGRKHYDIHPMEIIEIGAVKLNERLEIVDTFQSYIRPKFRLNKFALQFTGIPKNTLLQSDRFRTVIKRFIDFCGDEYKMLAWGGSDYFHLFVDCKVNGVADEWLANLMDMTSMFEGGLHKALADYELQPIGQHHSALDDALNAVQLLRIKPEMVASERYYGKDPFKICTGGIKKQIASTLDEALARDHILTWDIFKEDEKVQTYFSIMKLSPSEIRMVQQLFEKFFKMKYGRKAKKLQLA